MTIEEFLLRILDETPAINIVGGSPLFGGPLPDDAISINGFWVDAYAHAINASRRDLRRTRDAKNIIFPNTDLNHEMPPNVMRPEAEYAIPSSMPEGVQPTTTFRLLLICDFLKLPVNLYGVCGWASRWHDGDWEMHFIKRYMKTVTVHDPRPKW